MELGPAARVVMLALSVLLVGCSAHSDGPYDESSTPFGQAGLDDATVNATPNTGSQVRTQLLRAEVIVPANACMPVPQQHDLLALIKVPSNATDLLVNATIHQEPQAVFAPNLRLYAPGNSPNAGAVPEEQTAWSAGGGNASIVVDSPVRGEWGLYLLHCDAPQGEYRMDLMATAGAKEEGGLD